MYKKGGPRSRNINPDMDTTSTKKKRKKNNQNFRLQRMSELQERIKYLFDQIGFNENLHDQACAVHNYKQCDEVLSRLFL